MTRAEYAEAAVILRRLLGAVEDGSLTVGTERGLALMRRMEGAATAWEVLAGTAVVDFESSR